MKTSDRFLRVARVSGAHGLDGCLKLTVFTDFAERFTPGSTLYIDVNNEFTPFESIAFNNQPGRDSLLKLKNINDRDFALSFKGAEVFISKDKAENTRDLLEGDEFYYYDLIGCDVYCEGKKFGSVSDIINTGGSDILVLKDNGGNEYMVPFIQSMVDTSRISEQRIDISPLEGLIDSVE